MSIRSDPAYAARVGYGPDPARRCREEAPLTSAVALMEVVMSVLRFASRWLEPVGRTVT
jgi:hypothetical protein